MDHIHCSYVPNGSGTVKGTEDSLVSPVMDVAVMTRVWSPGENLVKSMAKFREPAQRERDKVQWVLEIVY